MHRIQRLLNLRDSRPRLTAAPAFSAGLLIAAGAVAVSIGHAQNAPASAPPVPPAAPRPSAPQAAPAPQPDPPARQAVRSEAALKRDLESPYQKWLNEEVFWIITPEERAAFERFTTDEERESFIERFWLFRDPTPNTVENEYKEEYYRRILYADDHFSSGGIPGWKSDRGMAYIRYGPPNELEAHRPGGAADAYPFEIWRWVNLPGVGNDVVIEFDDAAANGEYRMTTDAVARLRLDEDFRFPRGRTSALGTGTQPLPASMNQFDRISLYAAMQAPKPGIPPEDAVEYVFIEGTRRTPHDVLLALIHTHKGGKFDTTTLDQSVKDLLKTGHFADVKASYARGRVGWIVTFTVVEHAIPSAK